MLSLAVLAGPWPRVGVVVAALFAASAMLARTDERRAWSMLGALVLAPVLLLDDVWHSPQLFGLCTRTRSRPTAIVAAAALAVLAAAAYGVHRIPWVVGPLTALTVPFRIPISTGSGAAATTNNLLVPLYFVIAASALAWLVPVLWQSRAEARGLRPPREPRPSPFLFEKLLAAYIVLYALQALYSPSFGFVKAVQNEVFFYIPFAVLLARLRDVQWNRELLIRCLLVTVALALAFSLIGFVEEATRHLILSSKLVLSNSLHEYFTVNSVFFDPNIFGRYLALVMILLVATVLLYDKRTRVQFGSIVVLAILWTCLVFTLSRSSLVALALGLAVLAAFRWKTRPVIYLGVAAVVAGAIVLATHPSKFGLQNANLFTGGRGNLITNGIKLFAHRPLQGFGSGSFTPEYRTHFKQAAVSVSTPTTSRSRSPLSRASSESSSTWHWSSRRSWLCSRARVATPTESASPPRSSACSCTRCSMRPSSRIP